ncbi:MAG TPA: alpha-ribazole phosphatase [Desulfuromonadaceae bacterium]|jgi:alpha-ribazole phosphatase
MTPATRIYLVRHGQVEGFDKPRYNGQSDVNLTQHGLQQYHCLREYFSAIPLAACYTSDLSRCVKGAEIITAIKNIPIQAHQELRELHIGIWEGLSWQAITERWPAEWQARLDDLVNYRVPEGENLLDLQARVMPVINKIIEKHVGEQVLVVGHGGVNRVILLNAIGAPLSGMFNIEQTYGCLNIIDYYADGRATVKLLNGQEDSWRRD